MKVWFLTQNHPAATLLHIILIEWQEIFAAISVYKLKLYVWSNEHEV